MELLDPRVDFVFKRIFGSENNKDVLLAFLNRIFTRAEEPPLTEIILMNPYTDKDDPLDKQSIFDVYAKTAEGKLIDDIEMHFLELTKLNDVMPTQGGLEKAMDTLQYLSQDSEARRLYEARQKYLHDEASMLEGAKQAGMKEGIKEVARNMLVLNLEITTIAKATGLSEQEILELKK